MGSRVIERLMSRGHTVRALVRPGSKRKLPPGASAVSGSALESATFCGSIAPATVLLHLVGVAHPAPWKEKEFRAVDQTSLRASLQAARVAGVKQLVYVSVAHPAPAMRAYIRVREECESEIAESGINSNILRPWYVLGPGHRWPVVLIPMYKVFERLPRTRDTARRLGLVTIGQMVAALVWAVENPAQGIRTLDVPAIRALDNGSSG